MPVIYFIASSGCVLVVLIGATLLLPYLLRSKALRPAEGEPTAGPYLQRLEPHYWLGYAIAGLALAHAAMSMTTGLAGIDTSGLYFASGAFLLIIGQLFLGLRLSQAGLRQRRRWRSFHFWDMLGIAALGLAHIGLNSAMVQTAVTPAKPLIACDVSPANTLCCAS